MSVVSNESEQPRRSRTPGSFLGKHLPCLQQSRLICESDCYLALSHHLTLACPGIYFKKVLLAAIVYQYGR